MFNNSELEFILDCLDHEEFFLKTVMIDKRSTRAKKVSRLQKKIEDILNGETYIEQSICYYCFTELVKEEPPSPELQLVSVIATEGNCKNS